MTVIYYKDSNAITSVEITPHSKNLQKGEQVIFSYSLQKGWISKHLAKIYCVTNFRVFEWNEEKGTMDGLVLLRDLEDVLVWNSRRIYTGTHVGGYSSLYKGVGATGGFSRGQSVTVGDVVFMSKGRPVLVWPSTTNPVELKRLVLTIKKELYPTKELQRYLSGIRRDEQPSRSTCSSCGNENQLGSSFCFKCGHVLN